MVDKVRFVEVAGVVRSVLPEGASVEALEVDDNPSPGRVVVVVWTASSVVTQRAHAGRLRDALQVLFVGRQVWVEIRPIPPGRSAAERMQRLVGMEAAIKARGVTPSPARFERVLAVGASSVLSLRSTWILSAVEVWSDRIVLITAEPEASVRRPTSLAIDRRPEVRIADDLGTVYQPGGYSGGGGSEGARFVWEFWPAPPAAATVLFVSNALSTDGLPIVVPLA